MRTGLLIFTALTLIFTPLVSGAITPPVQNTDISQEALETGYHQPLYTNNIASLTDTSILSVNQSSLELRDGDLIFTTDGNTISSASQLTITSNGDDFIIDGNRIESPLGLSDGTTVTGIEATVGGIDPGLNDQIPTSGAVQGLVNNAITGAQQDLSSQRIGSNVEIQITDGTNADFTDTSAISACSSDQTLLADGTCTSLNNPDGYLPDDPATSWVNMNNEAIANLPDPTGGNDDWAATKGYVDSNVEANTDNQNLQGFSRNGQQVTLDLENGGSATFTDQQGGSSVTPGGSDGAIQVNSGGSLAGDASELFYDTSTLRVGIGTDTPASKLDVNGRVRTDDLTVDYDGRLSFALPNELQYSAYGSQSRTDGLARCPCDQSSTTQDCSSTFTVDSPIGSIEDGQFRCQDYYRSQGRDVSEYYRSEESKAGISADNNGVQLHGPTEADDVAADDISSASVQTDTAAIEDDKGLSVGGDEIWVDEQEGELCYTGLTATCSGTTTETCQEGTTGQTQYMDNRCNFGGPNSCDEACQNRDACQGSVGQSCSGGTQVNFDVGTQIDEQNAGTTDCGGYEDEHTQYRVTCECEVTSDQTYQQETVSETETSYCVAGTEQ